MPSDRYAVEIRIDNKRFAFYTGRTFRGLTISKHVDGWNIILRSRNRGGIPQYAMTIAKEPLEGFSKLWSLLLSRDGERMWHYDKFA